MWLISQVGKQTEITIIKKCGFRFKNWQKTMANAKVQWGRKINIKEKKTSWEEPETD